MSDGTPTASGTAQSTAAGGAVEREIRIAARPEVVWSFWVDPSRIVRWMGRTATLDPRPGGEFRVDYGNGNVVTGRYVELDEPLRLVFTWGWEDPSEAVRPGGSVVEVDLAPDGDGTRLRLRHSGLPNDAEVAGHGEGWDYFLQRLLDAAAS
jgi:uncharacterized protein YndB with AHSA1/START domain